MHGVDCTALRVDVGELRKSALLEIVVEFIGVHQLVHSIVLDILIHVGIDDIGLVVVLPGDVLLVQSLEDRSSTSGARHVGKPTGGLVSVVDHPCPRTELACISDRLVRQNYKAVARAG